MPDHAKIAEKARFLMEARHARHRERMADLLQEEVRQAKVEKADRVSHFLERLNAGDDAMM